MKDDKVGVLFTPDPANPVILQPGDSVTFIATDTHVHAGEYTNTVTAHASDNEGNEIDPPPTATATVTVTDVLPKISVTKTPDRKLVPAPSAWVNYTFVVKNESVEPVALTSLVDDKFGDLSGAAGLPKTLAVGESFTFTKGFMVDGTPTLPHTNTVTATANDMEEPTPNETTASASATVNFFDGSLITNTSYCQFDYDSNLPGNQFRLVYRPETNNSFILNGQNPGQFYYNAFVSGAAGTDFTVVLKIPFPFVNHGANPTHVYNDYSIQGSSGAYCLGQGTDVTGNYTITTAKHTLSSMGAQVIAIGDYGTEAKFGDYTTITVSARSPRPASRTSRATSSTVS